MPRGYVPVHQKLICHSKDLLIPDEDFLFRVIAVAFSQRRKTLLNVLSRNAGIDTAREELLKIFKSLGFSETVRGEELLLKDFMQLAEKISRKAGSGKKEKSHV